MSRIEARIKAKDTTLFFPDLVNLAITKLLGFIHGCFVVLTFNKLSRLPNVPTFVERVNAIDRHNQPATLKSHNGRRLGAGRDLGGLCVLRPMSAFGG